MGDTVVSWTECVLYPICGALVSSDGREEFGGDRYTFGGGGGLERIKE